MESESSAIAQIDIPVSQPARPPSLPQRKPFEGATIAEVLAAQDLSEEREEVCPT